MQIELRDMKLQLAKDIMELREVLSSVAVELTGVMDKHKSLLTRIEGLGLELRESATLRRKTSSMRSLMSS